MMMNSKLSEYVKSAASCPIEGALAVAGVTVAAFTSGAAADLKIWSVGQLIASNSTSGLSAADTILTASFNTQMQINFFRTGNFAGGDQVFWSPNNNLKFINYGTANDPAMWTGTQTFDGNGQAGLTSFGGETVHQWDNATNSHTTSQDMQNKLTIGDQAAFAIRFDVNAGDLYYGWVEVTATVSGIVIDRWALQDSIGVGAVYTPAGSTAVPGLGGLAALAMGAGGIRRKRQRVA
jgi:hypothetical protein